MSRFISIPGMSHANTGLDPEGQAPLRIHPNAQEFYRNRHKHPPRSGFTPGDKESFEGEPALVRHVEYDQHTGTEKMVVQKSSQTDSGTYEVTWTPTGPGDLVISGKRRIHD